MKNAYRFEGGLAMGLGYVLSEELRFRGVEILDRNFDTYDITRFATAPRVEAARWSRTPSSMRPVFACTACP